MKNVLINISVILGLGLSLLACASSRQASLEDSVHNFLNAVRRGDNQAAMSFVEREKQASFFENSQKINQLRISELKVQSIFPDEKMNKAMVSVALEYFSPTSSGLSAGTRLYAWSYDKKNEAWFVEETSPLGSGASQRSLKP